MAFTQIDLQFPCKECGELGYFMGFRTVRRPGTQDFKFVCSKCAAEVFNLYIKEMARFKERLDREEAEQKLHPAVVQPIVKQPIWVLGDDDNYWLEGE